MIASSTSLNSSFFTTYNRSGQGASLLRSEPVKRVVVTPTTGSSEEQKATDSVSLSAEGLEKSRQSQESQESQTTTPAADEKTTPANETKGNQSSSSQALTPEEQQMVQELKSRDMEVKTHEMAHLAAAGQYASGGASYTYQQGPDGRRYAIGGEVPIDLSAEKTPEETLAKMRTIKRAAMAPAEPSSADRSVAATATALESQARQEAQTQETEAAREQTTPDEADNSVAEAGESAETNEATESSATSGNTEETTAPPQTARAIDVVA